MILDFLKDSANLKTISRQGWIDKLSIKNPESVADHSYSMAIMAMIISDLENYDSEKILKMCKLSLRCCVLLFNFDLKKIKSKIFFDYRKCTFSKFSYYFFELILIFLASFKILFSI